MVYRALAVPLITDEPVDVAFMVDRDDLSRKILAIMPSVAVPGGYVDDCICWTCDGECAPGNLVVAAVYGDDVAASEYVNFLGELIDLGYNLRVISINRVNDDDYRDVRQHRLLGSWGL